MNLAKLVAESTAPLEQMEAEVVGPTPPEHRSYVIRVCRRGHLVTPWSGYRHGPDFWECLRCKQTAAARRAS